MIGADKTCYATGPDSEGCVSAVLFSRFDRCVYGAALIYGLLFLNMSARKRRAVDTDMEALKAQEELTPPP